MHVLVATVVHHPEDARIRHRQIRSLLEAGHEVTYAAPFTARVTDPGPGLTAVDLPRAVGRRRLVALRSARTAIALHSRVADLLLVHDPELLPALPAQRPPTVWDVHEDTGAALADKSWLPPVARPPVRHLVRLLEQAAERDLHLLLAEDGYRSRFRRAHPVVPNSTWVPASVPEPGTGRVVYLGTVTAARGAAELVALATRLAPQIRTDVIGEAHGEARTMLARAAAQGVLRWHGFVPNDRALALLPGALAGLSLLHDLPNYRVSQPTKVLEYMAHGLPVVSTPLPLPARLLTRTGCGVVVPFEDVDAAEGAVRALGGDRAMRCGMAAAGRATAAAEHSWVRDGAAFVGQLERWAGVAESARPSVADYCGQPRGGSAGG